MNALDANSKIYMSSPDVVPPIILDSSCLAINCARPPSLYLVSKIFG